MATFFKINKFNAVKLIHADKHGCLLVSECVYDRKLIRIINIYASNIETERKTFIRDLKQWCTENTIIFGDFNVVQTKVDISENNVFKGDVSRRELSLLLQEKNMCDVLRTSNPEVKCFSRRQIVNKTMKQSRIDLCIVASNLCKNIVQTKYTVNTWSDHSTLSCCLETQTKHRGGIMWCLNASLLKEKNFMVRMYKMLHDAKYELEMCDDVLNWWSTFKERVKRKCINHSKERRWHEYQRELNLKKDLNDELKLLDSMNKHSTTTYEFLKNSLNQLEENKCRRAAVRSRVQNYIEGEKCTGFFLRLEKSKQQKTTIDSLFF